MRRRGLSYGEDGSHCVGVQLYDELAVYWLHASLTKLRRFIHNTEETRPQL
jgi:hypothetical protein